MWCCILFEERVGIGSSRIYNYFGQDGISVCSNVLLDVGNLLIGCRNDTPLKSISLHLLRKVDEIVHDIIIQPIPINLYQSSSSHRKQNLYLSRFDDIKIIQIGVICFDVLRESKERSFFLECFWIARGDYYGR